MAPMKTLADLIADLDTPVVLRRGPATLAISGVVEDSRFAYPGCLFVARRGGSSDGRAYINDAVARGAAAVLSDRAELLKGSVATLSAENVPLAAAILVERFHEHPSSKLRLLGVTGTNGKTTTAHLVHQIFRAAGRHCGLIGTVQVDDGRLISPSSLTTPTAIDLSRRLRTMVNHGCEACAMEVSSHALHQHRVAGLNFDVAIFTNLSGDHLDYHGAMEQYAASKAMLFEQLPANGMAIINADDPHWRSMVRRCAATVLQCSILTPESDCFAEATEESVRGSEVLLRGPWGAVQVRLPLIGRHNMMNALQAAAACSALGIDGLQIGRALAMCESPPGRLEPVTGPDDPFAVYVDYAHTDDAMDNVLRAVKPLLSAKGKLRVVFGCGGDRDRTKRPRMARAAWRYADEVIITSDNPRTEDPDAIIREIFDGVPVERIGGTTCIVDRREAIHDAIHRAQRDDIVLIAGKGHEDYQIIGTVRSPFDDRLVAAEALASVRESSGAVPT